MKTRRARWFALTLTVVLVGGCLAQTPILHFTASSASEGFGPILATVGDLDGDGLADHVFGAPQNSVIGAAAGRVEVRSGRDGHLIREEFAPTPGNRFGRSLDGVGDVDGDGVPDVIVGAQGFARLLSGADFTPLTQHGDPVSLTFGSPVVGTGDVDLDGVPDYAVADPLQQGDRGRLRVYSGATGAVIHDRVGQVVTSFVGQQYGEELGTTLANAGDVDGDGVDDLIVGAPAFVRCTFGIGGGVCSPEGRVYVLSGLTGAILHQWQGTWTAPIGSVVGGAGDLNQDGHADLAVGLPAFDTMRFYSGSDGAYLGSVVGAAANDAFGSSVLSIGDVNGDGVGDVAIGATGCAGPVCTGYGCVRVLSGATGQVLRTFTSPLPGDAFGTSLDRAGDVDQDGLPDLLIGARGRAYVMTWATQPAATSVMTGPGCWPTLAPSLSVTAPLLGQSVTIAVTFPPPSAGLLLVSPPPPAPTSVLAGPAFLTPCTAYIDPETSVTLAMIRPDPSGAWSMTLPLPASVSQAGVSWVLQGALFPAAGGAALTNGVTVTLGY